MSGFSPALVEAIRGLTGRYPSMQAALLPILHLVQNEKGSISLEDEAEVAGLLGIRKMAVHEVVSFYTMFRREPVGRYHIQVCTNVSCALAGSGTLLEHLKSRLGIGLGETTSDGKFTLTGVECLGACEQAPCLMVNFDYHGGLDASALDSLLGGLP